VPGPEIASVPNYRHCETCCGQIDRISLLKDGESPKVRRNLGHRLDTLVLSSVTVHNPGSGRQNLGHYTYTLYILDLQYTHL